MEFLIKTVCWSDPEMRAAAEPGQGEGYYININISASGLVNGTLSSDYLLRCLIELFVFSRRKRELLIQSRRAGQGKIISRIFLHGFLA